eukprot:CAMPEP_0182907386 /NCGR_PEP_ID=MMETSP0034_2-20130328/34448_1 /TAXON_ID=156128 /ORGANISM="Nephroselmis pyriformis, Strain CCMP717" /LENGTH=109 /DNA_ID=CAMNT_0025043299 /DNA_START=101 /DNA_END=426 /DNA_ORIENTATION=-
MRYPLTLGLSPFNSLDSSLACPVRGVHRHEFSREPAHISASGLRGDGPPSGDVVPTQAPPGPFPDAPRGPRESTVTGVTNLRPWVQAMENPTKVTFLPVLEADGKLAGL